MVDAFPPREYMIVRRRGPAVAFFWLVQVFLGLPSLIEAAQLLTTGRAEGALFMIALFLAWIGATLAVGVGSLLVSKSSIVMPIVFPTRLLKDALPQGYGHHYQGFPIKQLDGGGIEVITPNGPKSYSSLGEFKKSIGEL